MKTVLASLILHPTEDGGRSSPILPDRDFGCPVFFASIPELSGHGYDCRIRAKQLEKEIRPGDSVQDIPIVFMSSEEILPYLKIGTKFCLWEGKLIGLGEITAIKD